MGEQKDQWCAVVDQVVEDPNTGKLTKKRPLYRDQKVFGHIDRVDERTGFRKQVWEAIIFDSAGIGVVRGSAQFYAAGCEKIKELNDNKDCPIIGPFDSREAALKAQNEQRPKTPREKVAVLESQLDTKDDEIRKLRAALTAAQKRSGKAEPPAGE